MVKKGKMCNFPGCRNPGYRTNGEACTSCRSRAYRARDPVRAAYYALRANCIRRKGRAFFDITLEEFRQFAEETKYVSGKGRTRTGYTIDRIDNELGYFVGNIRVISNSENASKATRSLVYEYDPYERRVLCRVERRELSIGGDNPF